jgi:zinc protease
MRSIDAELQNIREQPITREELRRAQALIKTTIVASLQTVTGRAERMQFYNQYTGDPGYVPNDLARDDAVTPADVRALAHSVLGPDHRVKLLATSRARAGE